MLLEVRQKQRAFFKRLGEKVKELCDKRKAIEEGIFNRLIERNVNYMNSVDHNELYVG